MKIKTSELIGAPLDWAVAKAEGKSLEYGLTEDDRYSTDWSQGGPIIDVERPMLCCDTYGDGKWQASILRGPNAWTAYGPTALVAAMRCFVARKLGNEADIPEELLP